MSAHKVAVSKTMGWWQAYCSCGWNAPKSYPTRDPALADARVHEADQAQAEKP